LLAPVRTAAVAVAGPEEEEEIEEEVEALVDPKTPSALTATAGATGPRIASSSATEASATIAAETVTRLVIALQEDVLLLARATPVLALALVRDARSARAPPSALALALVLVHPDVTSALPLVPSPLPRSALDPKTKPKKNLKREAAALALLRRKAKRTKLRTAMFCFCVLSL